MFSVRGFAYVFTVGALCVPAVCIFLLANRIFLRSSAADDLLFLNSIIVFGLSNLQVNTGMTGLMLAAVTSIQTFLKKVLA